jgi:hypothetical protein
MATEHIVALLIQERNKLDAAIAALGGGAKRRARPPKNSTPMAKSDSQRVRDAKISASNKAQWTSAKREAQAERMKAYWKKRKAAKG